MYVLPTSEQRLTMLVALPVQSFLFPIPLALPVPDKSLRNVYQHTKNVTSFFLSKPCHIDKLRLVKYADEFLTTLQSGLSKTSQKVVKYVSHNALLNSERGSNEGQRS